MSLNINAADSVIVFDLDDTLYSEFDYKVSGIHAVCAQLAELYPQYSATDLLALLDTHKSDWLDRLCRHCGLNDAEKASLLWHYRLHRPAIRPYMPSENLSALIQRFAASALISDGRSLTQHLKLKALGLSGCFDHILISEAFASEKPQPERFDFIRKQYPGKTWIYIGDNIKKDFVTPNNQGWLTIGLKASANNIHQHDAADFPATHQPRCWINDLTEIKDLLC
ncbi:HAD family hydrolase [Uruburuella testudinis]|uniref:HAD family hydrolase n=1 Tax=Uruburuella testudinis TaxID=1282863 RepID=A0ABY4DU21_9NEIS|nr:HAD family hydrolase [Uruburuella testudinis]UOO82373.1 HAD family hydrolase [Uruburuella testudinis]